MPAEECPPLETRYMNCTQTLTVREPSNHPNPYVRPHFQRFLFQMTVIDATPESDNRP